jgi:hypothetical protein
MYINVFQCSRFFIYQNVNHSRRDKYFFPSYFLIFITGKSNFTQKFKRLVRIGDDFYRLMTFMMSQYILTRFMSVTTVGGTYLRKSTLILLCNCL